MNSRINRGAWLLAALLTWAWTWRHLSIEWRTNEQYEYAIGVPFLFLYLAWSRWGGPMTCGSRGGAALLAAGGWLACALGELLRWHDPIWRLTAFLLSGGATLLSAAALWRIGGRPLLRREAFPLLFVWTSVPWPLPFELAITQNLLGLVIRLTTSLLTLGGIPALQHGNAIELANGMLGIDDACSGIRSLQAALMASLFLGEYFRLPPWRRIGLVLSGALLSFALNCTRVLTLALVFQRSGPAVTAHYHDPAGAIATTVTFLSVLGLALVLRHAREDVILANGSPAAHPGYEGLVTCAGYVAIPLLTSTWFTHVSGSPATVAEHPQWTLHPKTLPTAWRIESVEPRPGERAGLQFSAWQSYRVQSPEGWSAQVIHLSWLPGQSMPSLAFYHTPAMCMPWMGWKQVGEPQRRTLALRTGEVPCVAYRFTQDGAGVLVLQSLSSGGENGYHVLDPAHLENRWHRLLTLWRAPLRQVNEELLIYLPAVGNDDAQWHAATTVMNALLIEPVR